MAQQNQKAQGTMYLPEQPAQVSGALPPPQATPASYVLPYQMYSSPAIIVRKYGNILLVNGLITIIIGIVMAAAAPEYWTSISGAGIWSGIFVIIAGVLCMRSGADENSRGLKTGALVMCIFAIIFTISCCIMCFIGFATGISYNQHCYWDYFNNYICYDDCNSYDRRLGSILSLAVSILNIKAFILSLLAAFKLGRGGCCNPQESQGILVNSPAQPGYGGVGVASSNYQQVHPYPPPTSASYPQTSAPYSQQPAYNPNQPQYYPPQQYSQAAMPTSSGGQVTYGNDYQQQPRQQEQKVMPPQDAPPAYS
ncbi:uncharacterized protein [Clytia hemisphaerica]|uniref:Uncharacterized protein n=1 Tax=Clytia hemisphaerica TaxID=252671 RepID=A0A7M5V8E2_9CNID